MMAAPQEYPEPRPPLNVSIKTGPSGHATELFVNGQKITNARWAQLTMGVNEPVTLKIEYTNIHADVEALIENTAMGDTSASYKRVKLVPVEDDE